VGKFAVATRVTVSSDGALLQTSGSTSAVTLHPIFYFLAVRPATRGLLLFLLKLIVLFEKSRKL
jgi:hypothetical protein